MPSPFFTALLSFMLFLCCCASNSPESCFTLKYSRMCLRQSFLYAVPSSIPAAPASDVTCALACLSRGSLCQGFWLPNGTCEVFLFDQCSHMTNSANCTRQHWVYIRKQPNLPGGHLCPAGYGYPYFGSTYKRINVTSWTHGLNQCRAEAGLAKFADGMDKAEVDFMHWIKNNVMSGKSYFVGGFSVTGSSTGAWIWQACNVTFLSEVFVSGQPNGGAGFFRANVWTTHSSGLDDEVEVSPTIDMGLCECVNPFF